VLYRLNRLTEQQQDMAKRATAIVPTVLLVEGSQDDRTMYAEYLRDQQFRAVEIDNTADALALARTVDVVVTGIRVPGPFDGVELVRRLRVDAETKHQPVIVLTTCTFEPDQQRAYAAGCDVFLPKPCLPDMLLAEIRHALAKSVQRRQSVRRVTRNGRRTA
jgi:two-component system, cell cycle response regulator DivK